MEKMIEETVELLGLTAKERTFFVSAFSLGPATLKEIAKKARLERSTGYLIASRLKEKGFLQENFHGYRRLYATIEPKTLLRMMFARERKIGRKGLEFQEHLSELQVLYQATEIRPKIQVYEGKQGLEHIKADILALPQEILLWTNQESESLVFDERDHEDFIKERIKKNISIRVLAVDNRKGKTLREKDSGSLRETKLLPQAVHFTAETYLYGHKMAIIDYKKDIFGVTIESEQIVSSQRAVFEMTWNER